MMSPPTSNPTHPDPLTFILLLILILTWFFITLRHRTPPFLTSWLPRLDSLTYVRIWLLLHIALLSAELWEGFWIVKTGWGFISGFWRFYHQGKEAPFWLDALISLNLVVLLVALGVVVMAWMAIVTLTLGSVCELVLWKGWTGEDTKVIEEGEELVEYEDEAGRKSG